MMKEKEAVASHWRFAFWVLVSGVLLTGSLWLARWLTTPDHAAGQIIISTQDVGHPAITNPGNANTQPGYRASLLNTRIPSVYESSRGL
ncbi:hypothetical protein [Candidatus Amarolinea dominans]|uniref:hypothetical protein n=1 Tax=Candidatus Amarolinea dominans TaxID=3140696 RepID=UPI001D483113|nr:hypothetical protein [Anaerolineae bacterium]